MPSDDKMRNLPLHDDLATKVAPRSPLGAFGAGAGVGLLGGLIGLGGAEFRLPILISLFRFGALEALIINKAASLVVVIAALIFRTKAAPIDLIFEHWTIVLNLLAGSLAGAWAGASWATRLKSETLFRVIAVMLALMALALLLMHDPQSSGQPVLRGALLVAVGIVAGAAIGVVAALLGVAGGELLIPTIVLLFGADIRLAGSLSLVVSLPTMIVAFARYSQDRSFTVLLQNRRFTLFLFGGSVIGALAGGLLLGTVPSAVLLPLLAMILLISAFKVWQHK